MKSVSVSCSIFTQILLLLYCNEKKLLKGNLEKMKKFKFFFLLKFKKIKKIGWMIINGCYSVYEKTLSLISLNVIQIEWRREKKTWSWIFEHTKKKLHTKWETTRMKKPGKPTTMREFQFHNFPRIYFFISLNSSISLSLSLFFPSCRSIFKCNSIRSLLIQECSTFQYSIQFTFTSFKFNSFSSSCLSLVLLVEEKKKKEKNVINLPFLRFATSTSQVTRKIA